MKKALRIFAIVFCVCGLIVYTSMLFTGPDIGGAKGALVFLDALLFVALFFLLRKKKNKIDKNTRKYTIQQPAQKPTVNTPIQVTITQSEHSVEIPPLQGDYAKAIFLNAYSKASPIKRQSEYQAYLLYECGIRNAPEYHKGLIHDGYLAESSIENMVWRLTIPELKELLRELGQPVSGKKDILVGRILVSADDKFIRGHISTPTYQVTELGKQFLEDHNAYVRIHTHKNWGISWKEFDDIKKKRPKYSDNDVFWEIFNERATKLGWNGRNEYFFMYQILVEEHKLDRSIEMLLRVLYLDVSGLSLLTDIGLYECGECTLNETEMAFDRLLIPTLDLIDDVGFFKNLCSANRIDAIIDRLYEWKLPIQLCTKYQFSSAVHSVLNGNYNKHDFEETLRTAYYKAIKCAK